MLIKILLNMSRQYQGSPPTYFAYTYTTGRRQFQDDKLSVASSCYSSNSRSSAFQSLVSTQRINQLRPKSKIVVSKCSTIATSKKKSETQGQFSPSKLSIDSTPYSRRSDSIVTESIQYSEIKPFFNWSKFTFLCGVGIERLGQNGCLCGQNCPWRKQWMKENHAADLKTFENLVKNKPSAQNKEQIEKDLPRTHPQCPTFSKNLQFRQMLRKVLVAYSIYDPQMGYVQGVNMIAGVLLYHLKNDYTTFWALVEMMENQQLRMVYLHSFQHLRAHCDNIQQILMVKVNDLYLHMMELSVQPNCFLNGWLLSLMSTSIPMQYMHEVIDRFRKKGWQFIYQLVVTYLLFLKQLLLTCRDEAEFLMSLNTQSSRELGVEWLQMIRSADKLNI